MDNQNLNLPSTSKFSPIKILFIVLGLVVVGEIIWAISNFIPRNQSASSTPTVNNINTVVASSSAVVSLSADKTSVKVGDKITVAINVSANKSTDGTDLIINFDPAVFTVDSQNEKKVPVITGQIYSDYPINKIDQTKGKITVSGIATTPGGVTTNGIFGTINLIAKVAGTATLKLEFTKGSTADTNVTETGTSKDILDSVQDLTINIAP